MSSCSRAPVRQGYNSMYGICMVPSLRPCHALPRHCSVALLLILEGSNIIGTARDCVVLYQRTSRCIAGRCLSPLAQLFNRARRIIGQKILRAQSPVVLRVWPRVFGLHVVAIETTHLVDCSANDIVAHVALLIKKTILYPNINRHLSVSSMYLVCWRGNKPESFDTHQKHMTTAWVQTNTYLSTHEHPETSHHLLCEDPSNAGFQMFNSVLRKSCLTHILALLPATTHSEYVKQGIIEVMSILVAWSFFVILSSRLYLEYFSRFPQVFFLNSLHYVRLLSPRERQH